MNVKFGTEYGTECGILGLIYYDIESEDRVKFEKSEVTCISIVEQIRQTPVVMIPFSFSSHGLSFI